MDHKFEECLKKRLIVFTGKIKSDKPEIKLAEFFLEEAYDLIELNKKEFVIIALYNAVFHSARAILFHKQYREKSHYCLQIFLAEKTNLGKESIELFDILRGKRIEVQYGRERITIEENLDELYNKVEKFIEKAKKEIDF